MRMLALLLAMLGLSCGPSPSQEPAAPAEWRGVWLTNVDSEVLDSRAGIEEAMRFLAEHNFNMVYPVVWNKAMTTYRSAVMDSLFGLAINPRYGDRDPLQELIEAAHRHGLTVIPWFEFGFSSSYQENGGHLLRRKPHWAERDRDGNLLTKNGFEWMNPYHPEVQEFMLALVLEVVRNYEVEGVQGDDRLPANPSEGGYSAFTDSLYRAEHNGAAPPANFKDQAWLRWRADKLNDFGRRLYHAVKAVKPEAIVSWSPSVYPWAYEEYLQDWPAWVRGGYADVVHPQVYRYGIADYRRTLDEMAPRQVGLTPEQQRLLYPGILINLGDYRIPVDYLLAALAYNRRQGYAGEVFFFYEGLRRNHDELADTLKATFYRTPARLPWRAQ